MALTHQQIQGIIKTHKSKSTNERKDWDKWRSWYLSEFWDSKGSSGYPTGALSPDSTSSDVDEPINFQTNYPYAYVDTMIANVCPQNPQVTVMARRKALREAAQFREALINDTYSRNDLHTLLWKTATHAAITGRGFLKTVWNFKKESADIYALDPRHAFFDMSAAKWDDIRYFIEVTVLTEAEFKARTKRKGRKGATYNAKVAEKVQFGGYPSWLKDHARNKALLNEASQDVYKWVTVYEVYDFEGKGRYYHVLDDVEEPLFEDALPYRYVKNPFTLLTFNDNMTDLGGLSDVKLVQSLQERLNAIDTIELWHAHSSNPVMLVNSSMVDNPEDLLTALIDADGPGSMVEVQGKANAPLRDLIGSTPVPQAIPSFNNMRDRCNQVIEFILGIPQYSRGVVGVADVATEVALADTATRTRNGKRIKQTEDAVVGLSNRVVALYEEFLSEDTELPIRLTDSQQVLLVTRESLKMRPSKNPTEDSLDYDYVAIPYSPTENHRLVQLQKIQQYLPLLQQSPAVDQEKLVMKLLDLLQLRDIVAPPKPPAPAGPPGGPPGAPPGMPPMPGAPPGQDTLATGAMPPGTEQQAPPMPMPAGGPGMPAPPLGK